MPNFIKAACVAAIFISSSAFALRAHHHFNSPQKLFEATHKKPEHSFAINVNTVPSKLLLKIPGLGPKKADAIIEYRKQHGPFASLDELKHVSGIGKARVEAWRSMPKTGPYLTISGH